jgi:hypothetical protein
MSLWEEHSIYKPWKPPYLIVIPLQYFTHVKLIFVAKTCNSPSTAKSLPELSKLDNPKLFALPYFAFPAGIPIKALLWFSPG